MRIIAGTRRSRLIKSLEGMQTRPTLDKVKEALFGKLGPWIEGKRGLDLFAGSGNIGLEALSRGAERMIFVDGSQAAINIIKENIASLDFRDQSEVYRMDAFHACRFLKSRQEVFDFIYLDPPYGKIDLDKLMEHLVALTQPETMIVLESPKNHVLSLSTDYQLEKTMVYGTVALHYLRRTT